MMKSQADYKKQIETLEKNARTLHGSLEAQFDKYNDEQGNLTTLYRTFDRLKKKLAKESKTEADDKTGVAQVDALIKSGGDVFKAMRKHLADAEKLIKEVPKLDKEASTLAKDLEKTSKIMTKSKGPEAAKFEALFRQAQKAARFVTDNLVKHRGRAMNPDRDQKDFEKELTKYIDLVQSGKHRKADTEWMDGILDAKKVAEAGKRLKQGQDKAERALSLIGDKLTDGKKEGAMPDLKAEMKVMQRVLDELKKISTAYAKAMKKVKKEDVKKAEKESETKADAQKLAKLLDGLTGAETELKKRLTQAVIAREKLRAELKKTGAKV